MTATKQWNITELETKTLDEQLIVVRVHWECTGTDGTYSGRVFKSTDLSVPDFDNFILYQNLTKEQVLSWVHETMTEEKVNYWESIVDIQIEKQYKPKLTPISLPWNESDINWVKTL